MSYTLETITEEYDCLILSKKTMSFRIFADKRNYLIALLYYEFKQLEIDISALFKIKRSVVHYSKSHPYLFLSLNDSIYMDNIEEYLTKYPFVFPVPEDSRSTKVTVKVILDIEIKDFKKLKKMAKARNIKVSELSKFLLKTLLYD